jgi:hypothetical protein
MEKQPEQHLPVIAVQRLRREDHLSPGVLGNINETLSLLKNRGKVRDK